MYCNVRMVYVKDRCLLVGCRSANSVKRTEHVRKHISGLATPIGVVKLLATMPENAFVQGFLLHVETNPAGRSQRSSA